jgi:N-glycosylase/DNA lyase
MSQILRYWINDEEMVRHVPDADEHVIPGVRWGEPWTLFTPAYWLSQFWMNGLDKVMHSPYQARGSLAEEVAFCLLGGFGITAEHANAAFEACSEAKLIKNLETDSDAWAAVLRRPLSVNGKTQHYRFPNQKARFLSAAMSHLRENPLEGISGVALRDSLLKIEGIGPKTAGWITRNYTDADDVAILDIHLVRAGVLCGIFSPQERVEKDYHAMEARFIEFSQALGTRPAVLDCLIWDQMRELGGIALDAMRGKFSKPAKSGAITRRVEERQFKLF